ncbi:hypothetical protein [Herbaspirillum rhizosphaerae]|uniref:hypothetical protein n=1 Tax=Herbaspirillum rhizosphaerae TaxID=346179 RepID=UPI001F0A4272|nr:hypothetical protein [Herbaspirillum rhizosphaerae]
MQPLFEVLSQQATRTSIELGDVVLGSVAFQKKFFLLSMGGLEPQAVPTQIYVEKRAYSALS